MSDTEAVLFANEAFYRAFADRDVKGMDSLWSRTVPVSCLHPGWGPLHGRDEVMASWTAILSSPGAPAIRPCAARATVLGDVALVVCFEGLGDSFVVATNLFMREGRVWRIVHHQAGPTSERPPAETHQASPGPMH